MTSTSEYIKSRYLDPKEDEDQNYLIRKKKKKKTKSDVKNVNIYDDDINLNQIKIGDEDDEKFATKEDKPIIENVDIYKLKKTTSSWKSVEINSSQKTATKQIANESEDDDYDLSNLKKNKVKMDSDKDSDLDVRRKRRNQNESDIEVERRKRREQSDSDIEIERRKKTEGNSNVRRSNGNQNEFKKDYHESRRRPGDNRNYNNKYNERRFEDDSKRLENFRHEKLHRNDELSKKKEKKSRQKSSASSSRSKSKSKEKTIKHKKSRERSSNSKERQRDKSFKDHRDKSSSLIKNLSSKERHHSKSKHKDRKSSESNHSGMHHKSKHKDRSPKVKKINEISSSSSDEDIREKLKKLYDDDLSKKGLNSKENEELKQKYKEWNKGLKQIEDKKKKLDEEQHEMSKPLARYKDDEDLDRHLKEQELVDDPMLEYFRKRKKEIEQKQQLEKTGEVWVMPRYESNIPPPLNRYNIWPGYRWDGVDRGNGFETRLLAKKAEKIANEEEEYNIHQLMCKKQFTYFYLKNNFSILSLILILLKLYHSISLFII